MNKANEPNHRLGYYVVRPNGTTDSKIINPPLSREARAEFETLTKISTELQPILYAAEMVELAYGELHQALDEAKVSAAQFYAHGTPLGGLPLVHDLNVKMQLRVSCLLSASKSFVDHAETYLSRRFG